MSLFGNSVLAGSAGQGGADLGDTIDQSLRFRGAQYLSKTLAGTVNTFSISFWAKTAKEIGGYFWSNANNNSGLSSGDGYQQGGWYQRWQNAGNNTTAKRDYSAWYHVCLIQDSSNCRLFVNGVQETFTSGSTSLAVQPLSGEFRLGRWTGSTDYYFEGYQAGWYFIDGQALDPTDFGKYNEDGVWVPQDYTGTYGTNGFHLTFDSSQANGIGHDSSGNGNNFTASGFDEADVALYSKDLSAQGGFLANMEPAYAFNGSLANPSAGGATNGGTMTFAPSTPITVTSSVSWYSTADVARPTTISWNGTTVNRTASGWTTVNGSGTLSASNPVVFAGDGNSLTTVPTCYAIAIDGTATANILVDNTDNDVDYNDTPTSNYATGNPLHKHGTLAKANLGFGGSATHEKTSGTIALPDSGKYYWEFVHSAQYSYVGFMDAAINQGTSSPNSTGYWRVSSDGQVYTNGSFTTNIPSSGAVAWTNGDIIGFQYDRSNDEFRVYKNNSLYYTFTLPAVGDYTLLPLLGNYNNTNTFNFGQHPFIYTIPTGFSALQTNNLPEPTIKNGKEHFETVTYTGNGSTQSITGLEFQPDFVWIKVRDQGYNHYLMDSVRGTTKVLFSDVGDLEYTFTTAITSFNSDGFSLGANAGTNNNTDDFVAWCWKAGGTAVSNTDGTITSSVSANTDAGFSIVSYTGTGANATVGHGLTEAPEFVIVKNRESSANFWIVGTEAHGFDKILFLNTNAAAEPSSNVYFSSSPSNTVVNLGTSGNTNRLDFDFIMYAWHSVEGFSKFGSYTGNGSTTDGPFIYTGHSASMIIIKNVTAAGNWYIFDSARELHNPRETRLMPDLSSQELGGRPVDFLSNGFKIRGGSGGFNTSGQTYLFASFAESPFGGENAPPVTAR